MSRDLEENAYYVSQGGLVPIKWTAPEVLWHLILYIVYIVKVHV